MPEGDADHRAGPVRRVVVGGRDVLVLRPAAGRIRLGLVVPVIGREVDLTVTPSAPVSYLEEAARGAGMPLDEAQGELRRHLARAADDVGAWRPTRPIDPVAEVGGSAFPLLGAAYDRGAATVTDVPRWAVTTLASPSARHGTRAAFGDRATRPVVRALAFALSGGADRGTVGLARLGLALAGRSLLEPDQIVRVLGAHGDGGDTPVLTVDELTACTRVVRSLGARRGERVLCDAAGRDGTRTLVEVARMWPDVASRLPAHPPGRLPELADRCRALVVTDPGPLPPRARRALRRPAATADARPRRPPAERGRPDRPRAAAPVRRPIGAGEQGGLYPPLAGEPVGPTTVIPSSPRLARLDGWETEGLRFSRARTCGDLERWSRMLRCCVDTYGAAAVAGRSELLAIARGAEIRGCLELTPTGTIRQLLGPANRALDEPTRAAVLRALVARAHIDPHAPGNRPWYRADP